MILSLGARLTIVMFDENLVLRNEQYQEHEEIEKYRQIAKQNDNYFTLNQQLSMRIDEVTKDIDGRWKVKTGSWEKP